MTFEIDVGGRVRQVSVEPLGAADGSGGRFRVRVDDDVVELDARPTDLGLSLVTAERRVVDAALTALAGGDWLVELPHVVVRAAVDGRRSRRAEADARGAGQQRLVAPMPGRIVRVLVTPGDQVAARQGLVVIEAMKMENELAAIRPGTVSEVAVAEGALVEAGRLLVVVE
ncbi:MAG TPA: biotin/lipoyl-containing protein [Vicinamibacterales bacterium]|nr:biotin/lipoyl-containing protein [Vicinamibacterales bacterium]